MVILGDHTAKVYGDDTSCSPTPLNSRLVALQGGTSSFVEFGKIFVGEILLQAKRITPPLPLAMAPTLATVKVCAR